MKIPFDKRDLVPLSLVKNNYFFTAILFLFIILIYSNTLQVPFILDDRSHIMERPNLHLSELSFNDVVETFYIEKEGEKKIYRPISCLTIALNYYVGKFNVTGYHIVNIIIHLMTAFFLFKTFVLILGLKEFKLTDLEIKNIAGLATVLWAAHPIQTQAVTYIIQRMASLSALFYVLGIWSYLKFRNQNDSFDSPWKYRSLFAALMFFIGAIFSKENAVIFPLAIVLIELLFFNGIKKIKTNPIKSICILLILLIIPLIFFFQTTSVEKLLSGYNHRPFTLTQRLLTEPKILVFHISQLIYPTADRFSIAHSIKLPDSLFSPISNVFFIAILIGILLIGLITIKKNRLIGFCIFFYFIHHVVESSFLPLELIFEHRNYLPSIFFFLPISYGFIKLQAFYKLNNRLIFNLLIVFSITVVFFIGLSTYTRNEDWKSHESLWNSAAVNAPDMIRPYSQLGWYYTGKNHIDVNKARQYFLLGLGKKTSYSIFEKAVLWINIAKTYEHENKTAQTINALQEGLRIVKGNIDKYPDLLSQPVNKEMLANINYYLANNYFYLNDIENAFLYINAALQLVESFEFLNNKAKYLIREKKYRQANQLLQLSLKKNPENRDTLFLLGNTLTAMENFSSGRWFYGQSQKIAKLNGLNYKYADLYMAENLYLSGNLGKADRYIRTFASSNTLNELNSFLYKVRRGDPDLITFQEEDFLFKIIDEISFLVQKLN